MLICAKSCTLAALNTSQVVRCDGLIGEALIDTNMIRRRCDVCCRGRNNGWKNNNEHKIALDNGA